MDTKKLLAELSEVVRKFEQGEEIELPTIPTRPLPTPPAWLTDNAYPIAAVCIGGIALMISNHWRNLPDAPWNEGK